VSPAALLLTLQSVVFAADRALPDLGAPIYRIGHSVCVLSPQELWQERCLVAGRRLHLLPGAKRPRRRAVAEAGPYAWHPGGTGLPYWPARVYTPAALATCLRPRP
jgi:hypothetical protein